MNKLKEIRTEKRYKLKDIAEVTGVSVQAVHQWENGETLPPVDKLVKIARFYGCTVDELVEDLMTKEELEAKLEREIAEGEITPEEAEHEYQDFVNPEPRYSGREW